MPTTKHPTKLVSFFEKAVAINASDTHLAVGLPPIYRVYGNLHRDEGEALSANTLLEEIEKILPETLWKQYQAKNDIDLSFELPSKERFRVDIFWKSGGPALAARLIPAHIPTLEDLEVPEAVLDFVELSQGIVLVTGPTGAGKSTLLASMIEHINQTRPDHIVTLEDPIEFAYEAKQSLISQRELGIDFQSFAEGLKHVFRQDPDVVLIGEMRDPETIVTALTLAETGHLVFATLHTNGAASTIERVINAFPAIQQQQIRLQLSLVLRGVISQLLLPSVDGKLLAAREIMLNTHAVSNTIREGKTEQLQNIIFSSSADKMQDLDQELAGLVEENLITTDTAYEYARNKKNFR
ncbi:MAG: PilT/PilU family type 4a pilus ATPase [Patescibacteria group bacterium]|nr:PilT/PilU family type 4a pilus ATPase [Patescibacteria group bacterium]